MAEALGSGARSGVDAPGPADEVAVSSQPGFGSALPTAGVIMPMVESDRPWWLVPSLAVGGTLLVAVVALLAVILLQPNRTSHAGSGVGGESAPGKAAAGGADLARSMAPANTVDPGPSRARIPEKTVAKIAASHLAIAAPRKSEANPEVRRSRKVNHRKRRLRRDRKNVVKPVRAPKVTRPKEPRNRPRSITEILTDVGRDRPGPRKVTPRVSLPAKLGRSSIQGGMSRVMGTARACGRRFSTSGRISVRLVVAGSTGSVLSVSPKGAHSRSLTGRCVARALRSARFKPFARSRQSFYYTVILR
jgi:hypothetical protein